MENGKKKKGMRNKGLYVNERMLIKSELIEIIVPANTGGNPKTKIPFPTSENLRNTHIMGIEAYFAEVLPTSPITKMQGVIPLALMKVIFMTLQTYNGKNIQWQKPLIDFKYKNTFTLAAQGVEGDFQNWYRVQYANQRINYPKSYIEIADSSLISTSVPQSILLDVYYRESEKLEEAEAKASFNNRS